MTLTERMKGMIAILNEVITEINEMIPHTDNERDDIEDYRERSTYGNVLDHLRRKHDKLGLALNELTKEHGDKTTK